MFVCVCVYVYVRVSECVCMCLVFTLNLSIQLIADMLHMTNKKSNEDQKYALALGFKQPQTTIFGPQWAEHLVKEKAKSLGLDGIFFSILVMFVPQCSLSQ